MRVRSIVAIAVAAAAVTDPELAEAGAEAAGGEGRAVVAPEHLLTCGIAPE